MRAEAEWKLEKMWWIARGRPAKFFGWSVKAGRGVARGVPSRRKYRPEATPQFVAVPHRRHRLRRCRSAAFASAPTVRSNERSGETRRLNGPAIHTTPRDWSGISTSSRSRAVGTARCWQYSVLALDARQCDILVWSGESEALDQSPRRRGALFAPIRLIGGDLVI
jgi:hypothetical protein